MSNDSPASLAPRPEPRRGVFLVLLVACILGTLLAAVFGLELGSRTLLDAAVALGIAAGILLGVGGAQLSRQGLTGNAVRSEPVAPLPDAASPTASAQVVEPPVRAARRLTRLQTAIAIT